MTENYQIPFDATFEDFNSITTDFKYNLYYSQ